VLRRKEWGRGIVFIKEIVTKTALTYLINIVHRENYENLPMKHSRIENAENKIIEYEWKADRRWYRLEITAETTQSKRVEAVKQIL